MSTVSEFDIGDEILLRVTFRDRNGDLIDPDEVQVRLAPPVAAEIAEVYNGGAGNVSRESQGVYTYTHTVAESGVHRYRWKGTGALPGQTAATPDVEFLVRTTVFANP